MCNYLNVIITICVKIEILVGVLATHPEYSKAVLHLKFLIVVRLTSGAML